MAPEGRQQRRDVGERGDQQQEQRGLGAQPRAVAALHRLREELVERHERSAGRQSPHPLDPLAVAKGRASLASPGCHSLGLHGNGRRKEGNQ